MNDNTLKRSHMTFDEFVNHVGSFAPFTFRDGGMRVSEKIAKDAAEILLYNIIVNKVIDGMVIAKALDEARDIPA